MGGRFRQDRAGRRGHIDLPHQAFTDQEGRNADPRQPRQIVRVIEPAFGDDNAIVREGNAKKGDVLGAARLAGIMAAKRTHELIPLCHPLLLSKVEVEIEPDETLPGVRIRATVKVTGPTGVEMEALTAVSVACLTVYDMAKAVERGMRIEGIRLLEKHGGKSGPFRAAEG